MSTTRVCKKCKSEILIEMLNDNFDICPKCGNYLRIHARRRIELLADEGSFHEWDKDLLLVNPLEDESYYDNMLDLQKKHNIEEAVITGQMKMNGTHIAIGVMDTRFMMASMGHYVGEKVTRLFETAGKKKLPVLLFCCSGGARMQEGIISLMQMEKTAAAVKKYSQLGLLYISVLTNPTMGGVTASFAMLADIVLAEKNAMIGFAGARVIEQNTGEQLPEYFQTAEFQEEHGFVDAVINRETMREDLIYFMEMHKKAKIRRFRIPYSYKSAKVYKPNHNSPWEKVRIARSLQRPTSKDFIDKLFVDFYELHGDRVVGDDHAIIAGLARFQYKPVTVIGSQKGKGSLDAALYHNWGMPSPSGYRKILRLVKQAEKFNRPIIFFIDTMGASCGKAAEEQGQGYTIANLLQEMSDIRVPILSIVIGEGGSGGALALGVGNEVWMLENAVYSILTPEGYASILWKDNSKAEKAAQRMKLEAKDLYKMGVIDKIIYESQPATSDNMEEVCEQIIPAVNDFLIRNTGRNMMEDRYQRFRKY